MALALCALVGLPACFSGAPCQDDSDCGDSLCTRTGECSVEVVSVILHWTLDGRAPDEQSCAEVGQLSVVFEDQEVERELTYEPVRCTLGRIYFDRMPSRFDRVTLRADDPSGRLLDERTVSLGRRGIEVMLDLRIQGARVD
ncbi:MAG: hypothetical protein Tsb0020_54800 [Haliangiales bacterium]